MNVVTFYGNSKELFIIRGYCISVSIEDLRVLHIELKNFFFCFPIVLLFGVGIQKIRLINIYVGSDGFLRAVH